MSRLFYRTGQFFAGLFCLFTISTVFISSVYAIDGEKVFKANCAACHKADKDLVGPALKGVLEKRGMDWVKAWVKNPESLKNSGDAVAAEVWESKPSNMPPQAVSDEEIEAIFTYIEAEPKQEVGAVATMPAEGEVESADSGSDTLMLIITLVILLVLSSVLWRSRNALRKLVAEREGKEMPYSNFGEQIKIWAWKNKLFVAIVIVVLLVGGLNYGWDILFNVGVFEGYQPEQPIKFYHDVHAGKNKIDCNYCHSSARKGRTSGIPSANVCMNCHKAISEGTLTGTEEIAKIYDAVGWDPASMSYTGVEKPIKWVKVHNLPDHVYFNHSQHVVAGGLACQKCHGPVEEMRILKQESPLTMGWCINCHRETAVKDAGNAYYDEFHARLTDELKAKYLQDGKLTVDEIGGMECGKCHY